MIRSERLEHHNVADTLTHEQTQVPEVAYNLEAQELVIARAQREGNLITERIYFDGLEIRRELGFRWYLLYRYSGSAAILAAEDCDETVIEQLRRHQPLEEVRTPDPHPESAFGRDESTVAAVFMRDQVLYRSRGFDVDAYFASRNVPKESKRPLSPKRLLASLFRRR